MTKTELIVQLAKQFPFLDQVSASVAVNAVFEEISRALTAGDRVELRGFGMLSLKNRKARQARNPRTGASVKVGDRRLVYFRIAKRLHDRLNSSAQ